MSSIYTKQNFLRLAVFRPSKLHDSLILKSIENNNYKTMCQEESVLSYFPYTCQGLSFRILRITHLGNVGVLKLL